MSDEPEFCEMAKAIDAAGIEAAAVIEAMMGAFHKDVAAYRSMQFIASEGSVYSGGWKRLSVEFIWRAIE